MRARNRAQGGSQGQGRTGPQAGASPITRRFPRPNAGPLSPGRRRPAAAGSGANWGTRPSHSLPPPHPPPEGGSTVPAAATAAPCPAAPSPRPATANRLGVSGTCCAEPAAPAGRGRYPECLCRPRCRRTARAGLGRGRRKKTDWLGYVTSCWGWGGGRFRACVKGLGPGFSVKTELSETFGRCPPSPEGVAGHGLFSCGLVSPCSAPGVPDTATCPAPFASGGQTAAPFSTWVCN